MRYEESEQFAVEIEEELNEVRAPLLHLVKETMITK